MNQDEFEGVGIKPQKDIAVILKGTKGARHLWFPFYSLGWNGEFVV